MEAYRRLKRTFYRSHLLQSLYGYGSVKLLTRRTLFRMIEYVPMAYVELSNVCNAACVFCPYPVLRDAGRPAVRMEAARLEQALAYVRESRVTKVSLTPTTGELLTHKGWAEALQKTLEVPTVEQVGFYSNGILLGASQREKLLSLRQLDKLNLSFSVGGVDRESYHRLYGVDQFDRVRANLLQLFDALSARGLEIDVGLEVRLERHQARVTVSEAEAIWNPRRYVAAGVNLRHTYDRIGGMIADPSLEYNPVPPKDHAPCQLLSDTRFAADGDVWVCGCAVSEQPGDTSLRLGRIDDPPERLAAARRHIIDGWATRNHVPGPCRDCTYYLQRGRTARTEPVFRSVPEELVRVAEPMASGAHP